MTLLANLTRRSAILSRVALVMILCLAFGLAPPTIRAAQAPGETEVDVPELLEDLQVMSRILKKTLGDQLPEVNAFDWPVGQVLAPKRRLDKNVSRYVDSAVEAYTKALVARSGGADRIHAESYYLPGVGVMFALRP